MNHIAPISFYEGLDKEGVAAADLADLLKLARFIRFDEASRNLMIRNGGACIVLGQDGTVRIEGAKIIQTAERSFRIDAATIDLN